MHCHVIYTRLGSDIDHNPSPRITIEYIVDSNRNHHVRGSAYTKWAVSGE